MSRALVPLSRARQRQLALFKRFRIEFIRQHVRAASCRSAVIIADAAAAVLDHRVTTQREVLLDLDRRKVASLEKMRDIQRATEEARGYVLALRKGLLK